MAWPSCRRRRRRELSIDLSPARSRAHRSQRKKDSRCSPPRTGPPAARCAPVREYDRSPAPRCRRLRCCSGITASSSRMMFCFVSTPVSLADCIYISAPFVTVAGRLCKQLSYADHPGASALGSCTLCVRDRRFCGRRCICGLSHGADARHADVERQFVTIP